MAHDGIRRSRVVRTSGVYTRCGYSARGLDFGAVPRRVRSIAMQAMGAAKTIRSQWAWMVFLATLANGCAGKAFSNRSEPSWDSYDSGTQTESATGGALGASRDTSTMIAGASGLNGGSTQSIVSTGGASNVYASGGIASTGTGGRALVESTGGTAPAFGSSTGDAGCLCHGADQCEPRSVGCNIDTPRIRTASNCRFDDQLCPTANPIYCWQC